MRKVLLLLAVATVSFVRAGPEQDFMKKLDRLKTSKARIKSGSLARYGVDKKAKNDAQYFQKVLDKLRVNFVLMQKRVSDQKLQAASRGLVAALQNAKLPGRLNKKQVAAFKKDLKSLSNSFNASLNKVKRAAAAKAKADAEYKKLTPFERRQLKLLQAQQKETEAYRKAKLELLKRGSPAVYAVSGAAPAGYRPGLSPASASSLGYIPSGVSGVAKTPQQQALADIMDVAKVNTVVTAAISSDEARIAREFTQRPDLLAEVARGEKTAIDAIAEVLATIASPADVQRFKDVALGVAPKELTQAEKARKMAGPVLEATSGAQLGKAAFVSQVRTNVADIPVAGTDDVVSRWMREMGTSARVNQYISALANSGADAAVVSRLQRLRNTVYPPQTTRAADGGFSVAYLRWLDEADHDAFLQEFARSRGAYRQRILNAAEVRSVRLSASEIDARPEPPAPAVESVVSVAAPARINSTSTDAAIRAWAASATRAQIIEKFVNAGRSPFRQRLIDLRVVTPEEAAAHPAPDPTMVATTSTSVPLPPPPPLTVGVIPPPPPPPLPADATNGQITAWMNEWPSEAALDGAIGRLTGPLQSRVRALRSSYHYVAPTAGLPPPPPPPPPPWLGATSAR